MKVVIFCGGLGLRLREFSEAVPKPMVQVGHRPIVWHSMRYFAHFGHREFVMCLGYRAEAVKQYFLDYSEALSNDFVLSDGGRSIELLNTDIQDWRITFANTGLHANVGQRLRSVRQHLEGEDIFLANYGDNVTDAPLNTFIEDFRSRDKVAAFLSVRPTSTFHIVSSRPDGTVTAIDAVGDSSLRINGGFFIMRREIFDFMREGEELVEEPFRRLMAAEKLVAYEYDGFWAPMDTLKDLQMLQALEDSGHPPWAVWQRDDADAASRSDR
jgi:glucose-1-phosphate cytidylyltransferase